MKNIKTTLEDTDWTLLATELDRNGYASIPGLLSDEQCDGLINSYLENDLYRKTVIMERYRFGLGEYKYFGYPLPRLIGEIRQQMYARLAPIANGWFGSLGIATRFPTDLEAFLDQCKAKGQEQPTALILKYGKGGFNTLHQDLYGEIFFPLQIVMMLNRPGEDFDGGEFVLTQQIPRAQSKAIVLKPRKGDLLIFATNFKPGQGTRGFYRVNMKHGVAEVTRGERHTLGIIFHDAIS